VCSVCVCVFFYILKVRCGLELQLTALLEYLKFFYFTFKYKMQASYCAVPLPVPTISVLKNCCQTKIIRSSCCRLKYWGFQNQRKLPIYIDLVQYEYYRLFSDLNI